MHGRLSVVFITIFTHHSLWCSCSILVITLIYGCVIYVYVYVYTYHNLSLANNICQFVCNNCKELYIV